MPHTVSQDVDTQSPIMPLTVVSEPLHIIGGCVVIKKAADSQAPAELKKASQCLPKIDLLEGAEAMLCLMGGSSDAGRCV